MLRRTLLTISLLVATLTTYGNAHLERRVVIREDIPQSIVEEDNEEATGDVAEADYIVISKERMDLKLYDRENRLICRFPVALGSHYGDKQALGDMKTPEGEFYITQIQRASHWMYNDGKENIKGYYGNWFIRLNTKYSGIGIHGTHDPERIGERVTEGSIRINNYHVDSLRAMIDVGMAVRIESSRLDREADGKPLIAEPEPAIIAETPIMNESATPVIEERHHSVAEITEVAEVATESVAEVEVVTQQPKQNSETKATTESKTEAEEWYTIKDGDLVGRVAARYGMTLAEIKRLNPGLNVDRVSIGQKIRVKGQPKAENTTPKAATAKPAEEGEAQWHTVADGDLVGRIAAKYGTTVRRIQELNPDLNPDRIRIGQRIRVK